MSPFDSSWLALLGNVSDSSQIARMADLILDMSTVRPVGTPVSVTQAKGRALRGNSGTVSMVWPEPQRMTITYKRRHRRQTLEAFPFSVIVRRAPMKLVHDMEQWCDQWGDRGTGWQHSLGVFFFTRKNHATMFILAFKGMDDPSR